MDYTLILDAYKMCSNNKFDRPTKPTPSRIIVTIRDINKLYTPELLVI